MTKSSDEATDDGVAPRPPVKFDLATLPTEPRWKRIVRRIDIPVQLARLALLVTFVWFLESERIFEGISVFGFEFFPEINELFRGTPSEAWEFFKKIPDDDQFWEDLSVTVLEALLGFLYGAGSGLVVGLLLGRFRRVGRIFDPFLIFFNAVPKIAFAPILLLWYGVDIGSKVALATFIVFFIVQIPVMSAVSGADPDLDMVASSLGGSQLQKFRFVIIPSILGPLFGALRLASIYSLLAVVLGEFLASRRGLGQRLLAATNGYNFGEAYAIMTILAILALLFNAVIGLAQRWFLRWQDSDARGSVLSS